MMEKQVIEIIEMLIIGGVFGTAIALWQIEHQDSSRATLEED